jgi:[ribosomal protein S5]-alanine N-acetyltransferase
MVVIRNLAPPDPPLEDGPTRLRPTEPLDAAHIDAMDDDPEIVRWIHPPGEIRFGGDETVADDQAAWESRTGAHFAIIDSSTTDFLGLIGATFPNRRTAHLTYRLEAGARRRGHASRALSLVRSWLGDSLGIARVELYAYGANTASQRVAERAGFVLEKIEPAAEEFGDALHDRVWYMWEAPPR